MYSVDTYIKYNRSWKSDDEYKIRRARIHPNPLFTIDSTEAYEEKAEEVCPCCKDKNELE